MNDDQAYLNYPKLRHFYNKLWLAEELGYYCGPCGLAPDKSDFFIVRPIMNLSGMGVGSKKVWIDAGDTSKVPPGYFWCEYFEGRHLSITYENVGGEFKPIHSYEAFKNHEDLPHFTQWERVNEFFDLPKLIKKKIGCIKICNGEFIGGKLIEMHLRGTADPSYDVLFPVWQNDGDIIVDKLTKLGYSYYKSYDDADGFLENPRVGFMFKNKE